MVAHIPHSDTAGKQHHDQMVVGPSPMRQQGVIGPGGVAGVGWTRRGWGGTMFWDDLVRRWRRENRLMGGRLLRGAAGNVAVLLGLALYTTAVRQPAQPPVATAVPAATLPANP